MVQRDLDGKADGVEYGRFDGDVLTHREFDSDRDGDIDQRTDFFYNSDDLVKAREVDEGPDGDVDTRYEYDYNAEGSRTFEHIDEDGDGEIETVIKFKHNDRGLRVVGTGRSSETNEVELVMNHKWTKGGLLDLLSVDGIRGKPDKEADRLIDYIYDEHGNVDQGRFDYDANGRADLIVIYKYECWGSGDGN